MRDCSRCAPKRREGRRRPSGPPELESVVVSYRADKVAVRVVADGDRFPFVHLSATLDTSLAWASGLGSKDLVEG